ncbi:Peptidase S8/S53 domain - like 10 [Theobroma cacao]|nr:Peptidase S8/S53 domain - like 10 [Theobroma cacao]
MGLNIVIFSLFVSATLLLVSSGHAADDSERKAYIVYMGDALESKSLAVEHHHSLLSEVTQDEEVARQSIIHSYGKSFNGFAAYLTPDEAARLQENENVVSVFPNSFRQLQTTRSWDFIDMPLSVKRNTQKESDIIVGMLDSGIYIDAPSFDDKGFGPPPSKWKGVCQTGVNFTGCNNKVIGARAYSMGSRKNESAADDVGHGSHTASIVAGVPVQDASFYGLGQGTARGGVPSARIAVYKVCDDSGCSDVAILAAFDDAIDDGVDIISMSVGGPAPDYFADPIAIGSFHAMKKGILTSCSAGNDGPQLSSLTNGAPWILTVGATATDRVLRTPVHIGKNIKTLGVSFNTFNLEKKMYPLTSGLRAIKKGVEPNNFDTCDSTTLDENKVKGKILYCDGTFQHSTIKKMGATGAILRCGSSFFDAGSTYSLPVACVVDEIGSRIEQYLNSTKDPQGVILRTIPINATAPFVAAFSSRGPYYRSHSFLKPDIVAPGVAILAAYTKLKSVSGSSLDDRFNVFKFLSGTSMSCPHASAAAAYVKSFHPEWSTSAIKSALMTTASEIRVHDENVEFAYGAGQIDPQRAVNPGLVYELSKNDYIRFLCNEGYSGTRLRMVIGEHSNCSSIPKFGGQDDLNYPSMLIMQKDLVSTVSAVFNRTVTYVGNGTSTYQAFVKAPTSLKIKVSPDTLVFNEVNEKKSFTVEVNGPPLKHNSTLLSASLEWTDSVHRVRSPILVYPISILDQ